MTLRSSFRKSSLPLVLALSCIVILAISFCGCTAYPDPDPIRIGVLLPASGPVATHSLDGLAWAADAMNRQGGRTIELIYQDTSTGDISAHAEKLAGRDDIDIIIGPATSTELVHVAPIVTGQGKLLISPSVTAEFYTSDLFWRTCPTDDRQAEAIFRLLREEGVSKISLVAVDAPYGEAFVHLAPQTASDIRITSTASLNRPIVEIAAQIVDEDPDIVIAVVYPDDAVGLAESLAAAGSSAGLFLSDACRSPHLLENLGPQAEGIRGMSLAPDPSTGYAIAYEEIFGEEPPAFAAQAHDALLLAVYTTARQEVAPEESLAASLRWVVSGDGTVKGWDPQEAVEAAAMIRAGAHPTITGASGPLRFPTESSAGPLVGYYTCWAVEGGVFSEGTPIPSSDRVPALPGLSYDPAAGESDRPIVWMVYPNVKGDRSFADSAYRGLFQAQEMFSFTKREFSHDDLPLLNTIFSTQNFTEKPDLVITEGFQFTDDTLAWAVANPDIRFFTLEQEDYNLPNACDIVMVPYGSSYLAGVFAADITETGKVGVIAGAPVGVIDPFVRGFAAGTAAYNPEVNVTILYVGEGFEGFGMPERAGELARDLRSGGTDVILMIAGASSTGIVDVARRTGDIYLIGSDTDQSYLAPNLIIASVTKKIDAFVYHAIEDEIQDRFMPGQEVGTLGNGGTGLFISPRFEEYAWVVTDWKERAVVAEEAYLRATAL